MEKIGFIGLGIMGKPMAKNLVKAGYDLTFYARRPEVVVEMEAEGATAVGSSKAVAEATDIVVTIVTADPEVREVVSGPEGVLEGASEGQLVVDMSTISPLTIQEIAGAAAEKGVRVMDAPVSGGDYRRDCRDVDDYRRGRDGGFRALSGDFQGDGKGGEYFPRGAGGGGADSENHQSVYRGDQHSGDFRGAGAGDQGGGPTRR